MQQKLKTNEMKNTEKVKSAVDKPTHSIRASNWRCSTKMRKQRVQHRREARKISRKRLWGDSRMQQI